ncbi:MAG: DUF4389 domain-containing protein, partial [Wenzhouxiangella sp.]
MRRRQASAITDMNEQTRKALKNPETWLRLPVMALFFAMLLIATPLLIGLSLYTWVMLLIKAEVPESVARFGKELGDWFSRTSRYLSGAASRRPFPFEDLDCPRDPVPSRPSGSAAASRAASQSESPVSPTPKKTAAESSREPASPSAAEQPAGETVSPKPARKKSTGKKAGGKKKAGKSQSKKTTRKKASAKSAKKTGKKTAKKT